MMKKISKFNSLFVILVVVSLCFTTLTGCSKKEPTKIVIWAFDMYITSAKEAVAMYQKANPNVEFEIVELSQDNLVQKFRTALEAGDKENLPDIIIEEDYNIKGYLQYYQDYFVDLTKDHARYFL